MPLAKEFGLKLADQVLLANYHFFKKMSQFVFAISSSSAAQPFSPGLTGKKSGNQTHSVGAIAIQTEGSAFVVGTKVSPLPVTRPDGSAIVGFGECGRGTRLAIRDFRDVNLVKVVQTRLKRERKYLLTDYLSGT